MEFLKIYIIKLKTTFVYKELINNFFIFVIGIGLFFLGLKYIIFIFAFIIYYIFLYKKNHIIFKVSLIIIIIIAFHMLVLEVFISGPNSSITQIEGRIIDIDYFADYSKITLKSSTGKAIIYWDNRDYKVGDIINVHGQAKEISKQRVFKGFDYYQYLKCKKIVAVISANEIERIGHEFHIGVVKQKVYTYLMNNFSYESSVFLRGILLGDSSLFDQEFKNALIDGGIIHLFAISGLHIQLFISLLEKLLKKINVSNKINKIVIVSFLFFYLIITSWSPSVLRASLMYLLGQLNQSYRFRLSSLDIASLVFILLLVYNPYYIKNYGFLLSFLVSFIIIIFSPSLNNFSLVKQVLVLSAIIQLATLPVVVNLNNSINLFSPLINVAYIYIVSSIILPLSIILFLVPFFDYLCQPIIVLFIRITIFINKTFAINVSFPKFSSWELVTLFIVVFLWIKFFYKKNIRNLLSIVLFVFIFAISNKLYFDPFGQIYFLDLYNGESIVIKAPFNQCNVVIDTGDGKNNEVEKFLKNHGFKRIDYLVLTHNHLDHNGEAVNLINNFNVKNIVLNYYDDGYIAKNYQTLKVKENDEFECHNYVFKVLNPSIKRADENDNSIVLYTQINQKNFLFLGDATKIIEERLVDEYRLKVDVLKVAHHGSSTSTSPKLVKALMPEYAIIMNGNHDKFGFPHQEALDTLNRYNIKYYTTRDYYSIKYQFIFNNEGIFYTINQRI